MVTKTQGVFGHLPLLVGLVGVLAWTNSQTDLLDGPANGPLRPATAGVVR